MLQTVESAMHMHMHIIYIIIECRRATESQIFEHATHTVQYYKVL